MSLEIAEFAKEAIYILLKISSPILLIALSVGLVISLLQALTQIQEATLSFVPKIIAIFVSLIYLMPYMMGELKIFTTEIFLKIASG